MSLTTWPGNWSPCVNETGKLAQISLRTSVSLNGTKLPDGAYTGGTLGGDKKDMKRALTIHFVPEWRQCSE